MLALEWLFIALGMFAGSAQAAQGPALMVFPLTSVSSAYVPIETMPGWMQAIAENQPITHMVDAVRALTQSPAAEAVLGHQASYYVHALAALDGGHRGGLRTQGIRRKHRRARSGSVQRSRFARPGRCYLGAYVWTTMPELNVVVPRSVRWVTSIPSKRR